MRARRRSRRARTARCRGGCASRRRSAPPPPPSRTRPWPRRTCAAGRAGSRPPCACPTCSLCSPAPAPAGRAPGGSQSHGIPEDHSCSAMASMVAWYSSSGMAIDRGEKEKEPDVEELLSELEHKIDRLKILYEQYFMGIEKIE